jgi:hypothetical protein
LLIKKLQEKGMKNIEEFLTNPLLVSLLFIAFEYKKTIPFKKYLFYRQVYDASFDMHDLTKGESFIHDKKSKLEIDEFHRVMRYVGFFGFKNQKLEYVKDEILALISRSKLFYTGLDFTESDLLEDLLVSVPLFIKDGNYYRWAHKSLQEYFAAQFICLDLENKNSFLRSMYVHEDLDKLINVLDLFYDMDYKSFRNIILFELLKEFEEHRTTNENLFVNEMTEDDITERSEMSFKWALCFYKSPIGVLLQKPADVKINRPFKGHSNMLRARVSVLSFFESKHFIVELLADKKHDVIRVLKREGKIPLERRKDAEIIEGVMGDDDNFVIYSNERNRLLDAGMFDVELNSWKIFRHSVIDYKKANSLLVEIEKDLTNGADQIELGKF